MVLTRRRLTPAPEVVVDIAECGRGGGRTAVVLHGGHGPAWAGPAMAHLSIRHHVITPTHLGWAGARAAPGPDGVGPLARAYLDVLAAIDATDVVVVGISFGAWVGAQMALGDTQGRIGALVLIGPHAGPTAHDPALLAPLGAVSVPALVVCGSEDEVATPAHGRAWANALGRGELAVIDGGGHLPYRRAPWATFAAVDAFLRAPATSTT